MVSAATGPRRCVTAVTLALGVTVSVGVAQETNTDWSQHNFDTTNRRYAPLDQIDTATAGRLELAWSFEVDGASSVAQVTPLVVDGVMYLHSLSQLMAIDATTGEPLWTDDMDPAGGRQGMASTSSRIPPSHSTCAPDDSRGTTRRSTTICGIGTM